jgi:hypothetical protein
MTHTRWWPTACLALLLLATWCAYAPGLSGGFLFDDFINLDKLSSPGPIDDWPTFWRYITSGIADPLGRPLSLLSFLIDARQWPADPAPFLRTNVLLHLLNGALLFVLLRKLGGALGDDARTKNGAALIGTGLWMLHPLFVSTTLYIVQREAMLPATFTLVGLLAYVHGRMQMATAPTRGLAWIIFGLGAATVLAMSTKANGVLLPLLAWVIEACVLRRTAAPLPRWTKALALWLPAFVVFAAIAVDALHLFEYIPYRGWNRWERLLTEFRVLGDYLRLLIIPRVLSTGLYNDGYTASHGWLDPASTLISALLVVGLLAFAFTMRRRLPALACALLFFFAGHVLESTTLALELYFEHRNYLPAMLLFWPLGRVLLRWDAKPLAPAFVGALLFAIAGFTTWQRADLWGKPEQMTRLWAQQNQASSRAQATSALYRMQEGDAAGARVALDTLWVQRPHDLQIALNRVNAVCATGGLSPQDIEGVASAFEHVDTGDAMIQRWLGSAIDIAVSKECPGLDLDALDQWVAAARRNPNIIAIPGRRQDLHSIAGRIALARNDSATAVREFNASLDASFSPEVAGLHAAVLAGHGDYREALAVLDHYDATKATAPSPHGFGMRRVHAWVLERQGYWNYELGELRRKLDEEIAKQPAEGRTP